MGLTTFTLDGWTGYLGAPWVTDDLGCDWHVTGETGWRGSPAPRLERVVQPRRDGETDPGQTWLAGRVIELSGRLVTAGGHAALAAGMDRFSAIAAGGTLLPLIVAEDGDYRLAYVRRSDAPVISPRTPQVADWTLALFAPDPRKYQSDSVGGGETSSATSLPSASVGLDVPAVVPWVIAVGGTSGGLTLTNDGTAPTQPEFVILGPVVNPRIEHATTGRVLDFVLTLGPSDTLSIYPASGQVLLNGATNARGALTSVSSPVSSIVFPVGVNGVSYRALSSTGGSTLTVTFRPAYY